MSAPESPSDAASDATPGTAAASAADAAATNTARSSSSEATGNYWDYCPNCSSRLYNHGCKYRCPTCHYFMSCSDFD